jgi:hypothetical protein
MTSSKFGALAADVAHTFKVELIDAVTDKPIKDKHGKIAYIEVLSTDSPEGLKFDKEQRAVFRRKALRSRNGRVEGEDQLEENINKCAVLTKSWHLVDPNTLEPMDVPCTAENAVELYSAPGMNWLFIQPWTAAMDPANFIKRSAKIFTNSPGENSDAASA